MHMPLCRPAGRRPALSCVFLTVVLALAAGCGSWRSKLEQHEPLAESPAGVAARLIAADALVEEAVRAVDRHARFSVTLVHARRTPQLFKEARVLYGASLDTFSDVLDQYLRARGGRVYSTRTIEDDAGGEPALLIKLKVRVPEKVICWLEVRRGAPATARLAIIIDDVGNTREDLDLAKALPSGITFSVLPHTAHARECAEALHASGHTIMLHQPMEPLARPEGKPLDPGVGAVRTGMTEEAIRAVVRGNLAAVPYAAAANNHMGSKATADRATMRAVLLELGEHGVPFVDSLTCGNSVCRLVAGELGVPFAVRNAEFLDNSRARRAIRVQLEAACRMASRDGLAITIGHYHRAMLAELGEFDFGDVVLVSVEELFRSRTAGPGQ
ncbi:MAG: divergent polysaccharide deacetylase family protein [Verrucomicrobia bacterium]|nr:divergent polysaccharide deacetylase family protein [Verrucomicrobiota bacterium]